MAAGALGDLGEDDVREADRFAALDEVGAVAGRGRVGAVATSTHALVSTTITWGPPGSPRGRLPCGPPPLVEDRLDQSIFRVRADRTTELELAYLRAMAELGPDPQKGADVAKILQRSSDQLGPTCSRLIEKGLLFTRCYWLAALTVPQFDRHMRRKHELTVAPSRRRRRGM